MHLLSFCVWSQTEQETEQEPAAFPLTDDLDTQTPVKKPLLFFINKPHGVIASGFHTFVKRTDEFFAREKVFYDSTGSYIRLTGSVVQYEAGERGYASDVKVKIKLPVTEKKISLLLESDPNKQDDEIEKALAATPQQPPGTTQPSPEAAVQKDEYYAGVEKTTGEKKSWQFKDSYGIKVRSPLDYYARFRLAKENTFETGVFNLNQTIYWFDSSGWESDTSTEFSLPVSENILFRSTTAANWAEVNDYFNLRQILSITHKLSDRRALSYQAGLYGISDPTVHTTHYLFGVHYRQNVHEDYLFMDLIPQVIYRKENDFHSEFSLTFRLEMVFKG